MGALDKAFTGFTKAMTRAFTSNDATITRTVRQYDKLTLEEDLPEETATFRPGPAPRQRGFGKTSTSIIMPVVESFGRPRAGDEVELNNQSYRVGQVLDLIPGDEPAGYVLELLS